MPLPSLRTFRSQISTISPRWKLPSTSMMPAASRLQFFFFKANAAPSSTVNLPRVHRPDNSQRSRLSSLFFTGRKRVPMASPLATLTRTSFSLPLAITTVTPDAVASLAASILVTIPPVPKPLVEPDTRLSIFVIDLFHQRNHFSRRISIRVGGIQSVDIRQDK